MNFDYSLLCRIRDAPEIFQRISAWNGPELRLQEELRADFPDDVVRGAITLAELRKRAAVKFSRAPRMWFDRVGLEQSTSEAVARHKAQRFQGRVWDYCCGIGGDAIHLAKHCDVVAVDRDPAACLCARWNAEVYDAALRLAVLCADIESVRDDSALVHIDPDRRAAAAGKKSSGGKRRSLRLEDGNPDLSFLKQVTQQFRGGAIKTSPAANFGGKFPSAEIYLVSLEGECKEATIWFGELADAGLWRATVLPADETIFGDPLAMVAPLAPLGRFLFDPDPAVVRAGLIDTFACREGLSRLDDEEEFLTGDHPLVTPFARPFEVLAELANNDRAIRDYFRGANVGQVEIKCRRIPIDVEAVRRKLTLAGENPAVLIFARISGRARAVVCRRVT